MAGSSPAARQKTHGLSGFLSENRNNELSHREAITAAYEEHERVRETAIRVYMQHEHELAQQRLREQEQAIIEKQKREQERIEQEKKVRLEQENLRALEAQKIPPIPPKPQSQQEPAITNGSETTTTQNQAQPTNQVANATANPAAATLPLATTNGASSVQPSPFGLANSSIATKPATQVNGGPSSHPPPAPSTFAKGPISNVSPFTNSLATTAPTGATTAPVAQPTTALTIAQVQPEVDQYTQIHQNLKRLRANMKAQTTTNAQLKKRMGDMRRELRKYLGQLTQEKGSNKQQIAKIKGVLTEAISGQVPSAMVDPSDYIVGTRAPQDNASNNESQLPSLFIYLINQLSKFIIAQYISECGASPKTADPIGIVAASIFSANDFLWRGESLIDILMAKFRVVCPVVFGFRGNETTAQGKMRLGWKKDKHTGGWIPEQQHTDRMTGLGAGYASIALRNFSNKSASKNPWPPSRYWTSFANIVNTPPAEITNTQCVVLRGMIQFSEDRFIMFYGTAAIAALRKALVEFPSKAQTKTPGVMGLEVLGELYKKNEGLDLR